MSFCYTLGKTVAKQSNAGSALADLLLRGGGMAGGGALGYHLAKKFEDSHGPFTFGKQPGLAGKLFNAPKYKLREGVAPLIGLLAGGLGGNALGSATADALTENGDEKTIRELQDFIRQTQGIR